MATVDEPEKADAAELDAWLDCLETLLTDVKRWAEGFDWSTRRISLKMKDSRLGAYSAPALILQKEMTQIILDPIGRWAPGADGVVDLSLMPAYDDIASLYLENGKWQMHYLFNGDPAIATIWDGESVPLGRETLGRVLDAMCRHAA